MNLVSLRKNHSELIKHFTLLIEVRRHFQDSNESADGVVVRLKLFIKDADAVPQLGILNIFETVESSLVSVKCFL